VLAEIGAPFALKPVDREHKEQSRLATISASSRRVEPFVRGARPPAWGRPRVITPA
jgi:hypothetical protein